MTTVSGFEVRLGNFEDMAEKIRWLRAVEPILVSEGNSGGVITVSTGENASYLAPEETPAPDGGTEPDAGSSEPDAGATPDAGSSEPDAGSSGPDAGSEPESSAAPSDEPQQTPPPSEEPDAPEEAG